MSPWDLISSTYQMQNRELQKLSEQVVPLRLCRTALATGAKHKKVTWIRGAFSERNFCMIWCDELPLDASRRPTAGGFCWARHESGDPGG